MKIKNAKSWEAKHSAGMRSLPCLSRNISIDDSRAFQSVEKVRPQSWGKDCRKIESEQKNLNEFSTAHKKSAYALELNVKAFIDYFGIDYVGFLTLTFADDVKCPSEAQRRFNSMRTNFLRHHYRHYIRVVERTKTGRIHYHLLVATSDNIRRGLNFRQITARNYSSANKSIRTHWQRLRDAMPKYGFGRSELLPVKTNSKGLARYIAKYIGKHINSRISADKGVRLCQTSQCKKVMWKVATSNFQFVSPGSKLWRQKLAAWVLQTDVYLFYKTLVGGYYPNFKDYKPINAENYLERLKQELGSKWAFANRDAILKIELTPQP